MNLINLTNLSRITIIKNKMIIHKFKKKQKKTKSEPIWISTSNMQLDRETRDYHSKQIK